MSDRPAEVPFSIQLFARWADMDFNQHMRNAAYLGASEDCRMRFLAERGFTMEEFRRRQIGPVVVEDSLVYKRELALLEPFTVEMALAGLTHDGRRMKVRNTIRRTRDGVLSAVVQSVVLWLDLSARKPICPPDDLRSAWFALARTEDFIWLDEGA